MLQLNDIIYNIGGNSSVYLLSIKMSSMFVFVFFLLNGFHFLGIFILLSKASLASFLEYTTYRVYIE